MDRSDKQRPATALEQAQKAMHPQPPKQKMIPSQYIPQKMIELLLEKGLRSKLEAKDKYGKTILDWAVERRCIALEKLQKSESDLKIIAEYNDVIELLLSQDIPYSKENETMHSKIVLWAAKVPASLRIRLPKDLHDELKQWRQKLEESQSKTEKNN